MLHFKARQIEEMKKWRYSCEHGGDTHTAPSCLDCEGHNTPEEACECYRQYLLDNLLHLEDDLWAPGNLMRCNIQECEAMTRGGARITGRRTFMLCQEHRTRETMEKIYPKVHESWES